MINISRPSLTSLAVKIGHPDKPSASANLHVADNISMGAKMHFPGPWLDQKRASLSPMQQKMFDVAVKVLSGKERPKAVRKTESGREIELDRPAHGATTISIGLEKPMSEVLDFLGMSDGKGRALLTLGTKMANALSPPPQQAQSAGKSKYSEFLSSCASLGTTMLGNALRDASVYGRQQAPVNNSPGLPPHTSGNMPPPLPPRSGAGANAKPNPNAQAPRTDAPAPVPPRPPRESASTGQRPDAQSPRTDAPPPLPPRAKAPNPGQQGRQERPFNAPPRSNSAPPPRPPKERQSAEQPNWQAPPFGERMRANSFPGTNPGSFEPDANEANAAAGNAAPQPGTKRRMSREEFESKINDGGRTDDSKPRVPPRPEKTSGRPETEQPKASAADASAKVAEDAETKPAVKTLYEHLGLSSENATATEIRKAYLKGSLKFHPDRNRGNATATAEFQKLSNAYEILSDDKKRKDYDDGVIDDQGHNTGVPSPFNAKR